MTEDGKKTVILMDLSHGFYGKSETKEDAEFTQYDKSSSVCLEKELSSRNVFFRDLKRTNRCWIKALYPQ